MEYQEHGSFAIRVEGKLLFIDGTGPFNEELVERYKSAIETCIVELEHAPWNQILTLHEMSLFTPRAEEALTQTLINRRSRGLVACAVIIKEESGKGLMEEQMSRCYRRSNVMHQYFDSMEQAKAWLATLS